MDPLMPQLPLLPLLPLLALLPLLLPLLLPFLLPPLLPVSGCCCRHACIASKAPQPHDQQALPVARRQRGHVDQQPQAHTQHLQPGEHRIAAHADDGNGGTLTLCAHAANLGRRQCELLLPLLPLLLFLPLPLLLPQLLLRLQLQLRLQLPPSPAALSYQPRHHV